MIDTVQRNASLDDLATLLKDQQARKVDMVVPASALRSEEGMVVVKGVEPILSDDGVTMADGLYRPTGIYDEGLAGRLDIPIGYVRRLRGERPDLLDQNVNGLLHGRRPLLLNPKRDRHGVLRYPDGKAAERGEVRFKRDAIPGDPRKFLLRAFKGEGDEPGIARALLSDRYNVVDHLDVLMAALDGVRAAGVHTVIEGCDLSERRMTVRVVAPEVQVLAERLLKGYRNPFGKDFARWREAADREGLGYGGEEPVVFAGFRISNSETGGGAYTIVPEMKIKVCANGLVMSKDAIRQVHLGGRLEEGLIHWSSETQRMNVELIKAKTADAVKTFLNVDYMEAAIAKMTEDGEREVAHVDEVKTITKRLSFSEEQITGVLDFFIRGGQMNRAGVMNAVTAFSQTVTDPDAAHLIETRAVEALTA